MLVRTIFIISLFLSLLISSEIKISKSKNNLNILNQTELLQTQYSTNIKDILKSKEFKPFTKDYFKYGYSEDKFWHKIEIYNDTNSSINRVIQVNNTMIDEVYLYTISNNSIKEEKKGILHNLHFDEYLLTFYFDITLKANEKKEFYIMTHSKSSAYFYDINLMNKDKLYQKEMHYQIIMGMFFASIIALMIYNIFVFIFTRELPYLWYVGYLFFTIWTHLSYSGMMMYILPLEYQSKDAFMAIFYIAMLSSSLVLFERDFLETRKYPKIDVMLKYFLYFNAMMVFATYILPFDYYPIDLSTLGTFMLLVYAIFASYYIAYKGSNEAKYFAVGYTIVMFGFIKMGVDADGIYCFLDNIPYSYEISVFVEAVIFAVILSNKLNKTKELEIAVEKNTLLKKELYHRTKNDLQYFKFINRAKLENYIDKKYHYKFDEIDKYIVGVSELYQMLYNLDSLNNISTKDFFETIAYIRYDEKINIKIKADTRLNIRELSKCGIILNELITNSYKYAFDDNGGEIKISLIKDNEKYILNYIDNGKGFDITKQTDTFGLMFIKSLVEFDLNGKIEIDSKSGANIKIIF